jgi:4-aminobutyrate aminotransferase-like enzyme
MLARRRRVLGSGPRLYYDVPFAPVRGRGVFMYDSVGKRYLDAYNNVPHVGHCHPKVVDAICRQAGELNTNTRYLFDSVLSYAERLVKTASEGLDTVLFTCTGSEANDLAWRLARAYTGHDGVVTTNCAYHGNTTFLRTIDASASKPSDLMAGWWSTVGPAKPHESSDKDLLPIASHEYADELGAATEALRRQGHEPAAFYFDTYFCSEGVHAPCPGFIQEAVERFRKSGGIIIADEVQPGLARCGETFWGYQQHGIVPDIVTSGKPMGNGHPIGAVITRHEIAEAFFKSDRYFNTFAGNPVSCAAGIAVLDVISDEALQENANRIGNMLFAGLHSLSERHEIIGGVRGAGLLIGVELVTDRDTMKPAGKQSRQIINELCKRGVLVGLTGPNREARNIMKIRPPLVFDESNVDQLLTTLDEVLTLVIDDAACR